jgi:hypothetical protein
LPPAMVPSERGKGKTVSIVVIMEWDDVVPDESQYWAITDKLGTRDRVPEGCEYHVVGVDPGKSVRVCEVWESDEAHGRFMEQVGPFFQEVGVPPPSKVTVLPLLRHLGSK